MLYTLITHLVIIHECCNQLALTAIVAHVEVQRYYDILVRNREDLEVAFLVCLALQACVHVAAMLHDCGEDVMGFYL